MFGAMPAPCSHPAAGLEALKNAECAGMSVREDSRYRPASRSVSADCRSGRQQPNLLSNQSERLPADARARALSGYEHIDVGC